MSNRSPRIICGFPGVGKTTLYTEAAARGVKIVDSDSSTFDKAQFPSNYIAHIRDQLADGNIVLCSTHAAVREMLWNQCLDFALVYPKRALLVHYLQRYRERGSSQEFISMMATKWNSFIDDCANDQFAAVSVELRRPDLSLADVVNI